MTLRDTIRAELDSLVEATADKVMQALASMLGGGEGTAPRRGRKPGAARTKPGAATARANGGGGSDGRRLPAETEALGKKIVACVAGNAGDGMSVKEIGAALGLTTKDLQLPVRKALGDKLLRTTGQKAGTRYFATAKGAKSVNSVTAAETPAEAE